MAKKIILVHGLGGTADSTWGNFPDFLEKDQDIEFGTVSCGYESPSLWKIFKRAPSIVNIANGVLTDIEARCDIENDEIILAGHSLGGVIVKKVLLLLANRRVFHKIVKVCFFDVPHDGSGFANVLASLSWRNRHLKSLCRDSSELDDLNDQWISSELNNSLDIISIISANDDIVSSSSSKSIFREHEVATINDVNHRTIVKPESTKSSVYVVFKKFILKKNTIVRFKNSASRDLEDWKSVERNHSYHYASDEKRTNDYNSLLAALAMERAVIRLTGASGLGKTRLLLEAIDNSTSIDENSVLIFNAPGYETSIKESVRAMVEDRVDALVIVENCKVDLHNYLIKEVNKTDCLLKLVTVGYSHEQVDESIYIPLSPLSHEAIRQVLSPILVGMDSSDVDRVARFAQGYPLMATLIAEQYQKEGRLLGSIESDSVVRKLIDGDGGITDDDREMLSACSLFDVFGAEEGTAGEEARFIAEVVAGSELKAFNRVLRTFTSRQIINRAGRYARVVPKPLALTLASQWWKDTPYDRQKELIDTLPDSLMQSFCTQAAYLDDQPSVQRFSDRLFGGASPFVQAEELLTERGSKLFRAFVEVNPKSTSDALYAILSKYSHEQLQGIDGDTRRNLVWGLEKLCFHAEEFEKSAWSMLLLASAENEPWGNNASGMFAQLFRVHLSGTQAMPDIRFDLLKRALDVGQLHFDIVVMEALRQATSMHGGSRTVGAEYQGTKPPLEEWHPESWEKIFDFWKQAVDLMLVIFERGDTQKERVLVDIGHSIRGFVNHDRIDMLDEVIRKIISINGHYWPAALESVKNSIQHDSNSVKQETKDILNSWLKLLSPADADLPEKLKMLVVNPSWEFRQEEGRDIDVAAENAKALATEVSENIDELIPHLDLLLAGEQNQSFLFGNQLASSLIDPQALLKLVLERLASINRPNLRFALGLFHGLFERFPELWQENIDSLLSDERLVSLYPDFIGTGDIQKNHLETLLGLIQSGILSPNSANTLSYGSVTNSIEPNGMVDFCLSLAKLDGQASWSALNIIYMYCYGKKDCTTNLREPLKQLVTAVPLYKGQKATPTNLHHWHDLAGKILIKRDEGFAIALINQLIFASKQGFDYGNIWSYVKPLMLKLMSDYGELLWPIFGDAVMSAEGMERYWLGKLLDRENSLTVNKPSVFSVLPVETIIEWCAKSPDIGPIFIARTLNIFENVEEQRQPSELFLALLENFGDDTRVANELNANMGTRGWSGSLVPYLESDKLALSPLIEHENANVRSWAKDHIGYIDRKVVEESRRDEEQDLGFY